MTRTVLIRTLQALVLAACLGSAVSASAGIRIVILPPAEFIATATPVFFEGHAAYWYGDHWYYRHGNSWRYYEQEPGYLHQHREHHPMARHFYGRGEHDRDVYERYEVRHEERHDRDRHQHREHDHRR